MGKNAYAQALALAELYEIQMQAMQLSVGSFDALKTVNKELTKAMNIGFSESGAHNQQLFLKTQEQIKRVAVFAKNYADNLEELKKELSKDFKKDLSQYVEVDDLERQIQSSLSNYVNNNDFEYFKKEVDDNTKKEIDKLEKKLVGFVEADDVEKQIKNTLKNYVKKDYIDDLIKSVEQNLQIKINKAEERTGNILDNQITNLTEKLKDFARENQVEEKINEKILTERDNIIERIEEESGHVEKIVKNFEERMKIFEDNMNSKQKNNWQTIVGSVLGAVGTILALISIFAF